MDNLEGKKFGTYEIQERLGEGGMGVVHRALDTRLNRQVAVKVLSSAMASDPNARERLRREALAAASLDHPYVCKIFEIGEENGALFLVMEFVAGETLHRRLHRERMSLADVLRVSQEVAEALEEAHARRLVHRDLKPANIMLTAQGHVKVMDFGLAKQMSDVLPDSGETLAADAGPLTAAGSIVGTPDYMSPEQVSGGELDARSDQFSFGVILAEMLSGSHPFHRATTMETLSAVLRDTADIRGEMPQSLRVVVRRMLAKSPDERFAFMERVARLTPVVTFYEDMHWADEPTLLLLENFAKAVGELPILIVMTYRDVDLEVGRPFARTLESLLKQKLATRILLRRLPVEGVERMLAALSAQTPPKSLARVVFEETEGNPFFVEEVFRHLVEEGKLFDNKGAFLPGLKVDQLQVPEGVRLVLGRRLQRLSDDARRILTTAAVLGRSFPLHLLEDLEKGNPDAVLDAMEEAERAHLVESESRGRETRYRFVHELVRHTLIESLSLPRRQRLHARIAEGLERVYANTLNAHVPMLAHHLYEAGLAADAEKTVHYLTEAASQASLAAAYEDALGHLDNVLSLIEGESSLRAGDLHTQRGVALLGARRTEEAIAALERAADIFEQVGEYGRFIEACYKLFNIFTWSLQFERGEQLAARMEKASRSAPPFVRWLSLLFKSGTIGQMGRIDESLQLLEEAAAMPSEGRPGSMSLFQFGTERSVRLYAGQFDLAAASARRFAELLDQKTGHWLAVGNVASLMFEPGTRGRPQEGIRITDEMIPIAERVGHDDGRNAMMQHRAAIYFALGDLQRGLQLAREAWEFARSANVAYQFATGAGLGFMLCCCGQIEEGLPLIRQSCEFRGGYWSGIPEAVFAFGLAAAGQDSRDAEAACRALLHWPGVSRSMGTWGGVVILAEALALQGRTKEAADLLPDAERVATEWDVNTAGQSVRTAAGIAAAGAGDWVRSEEHHRAAIDRMDSCGYKLGAAIARIRYADMLRMRRAAGDETAARELLEAGLRRSEAMGLTLYARVAREKLSSI